MEKYQIDGLKCAITDALGESNDAESILAHVLSEIDSWKGE